MNSIKRIFAIRMILFILFYMNKIFLQLEGKTDDLLMVSKDDSMKSTRLIKLPEDDEEDAEIIDIAITSTNIWLNHPEFNKLLGKKIRMTVEILEDELN